MSHGPTGQELDVGKLAALGWSIIPCGLNKKPFVGSWKPYQSNPPSIAQLCEWKEMLKPPAWAVITGAVSRLMVADFDGEKGQSLLVGLGLDPHVRSGGGGKHAYFIHPGWHVPTLNWKVTRELGMRWPGLDIRGDGGYAICLGRSKYGEYRWLRDPVPDSFELLPSALREFLRLPNRPAPVSQQGRKKTAFDGERIPGSLLIERALEQVPVSGRNKAGFWLATQLRDNSHSQNEAENIMMEFAAHVPGVNLHGKPEPYTHHEVLATLRQAYSRPAREPWVTSSWPAAQPSDAPDTKCGANPQGIKPGFFQRNTEPKAEVVEGLIREGQIVTLGGPYGVGKSPLLQELTICRLSGIPWLGRKVKPGPVIAFDFESSSPAYKGNLIRITRRHGAPEPQVPNELEPYLQNDDLNEPLTARLLQALKFEIDERLKLIREALYRKPDALVIVDPTELLFRLDTTKKQPVNLLFAKYRRLLADYPQAVLIGTFNMRKLDRKSPKRANLLLDPRGWLEEVCGTLDLMNRSDVRLGMDFCGPEDEDMRVLNGVRRGEDLHPILIRPFVYSADDLAGFERVPSERISLAIGLSPKQREYWQKLPREFTWATAVRIISKSSLSRLKARAQSLGILEEIGAGAYRKLVE